MLNVRGRKKQNTVSLTLFITSLIRRLGRANTLV